jgi:hypothetical protein
MRATREMGSGLTTDLRHRPSPTTGIELAQFPFSRKFPPTAHRSWYSIPSHLPEDFVVVRFTGSNIQCLLRIAFAGCAAIVAVACGGGDNSSSSTTTGYWPEATFAAPTQLPTTATHAGKANPGACMVCHAANGSATTKLVYGGTVYKSAGGVGAPGVEVGVVSGTYRGFAFTSADGFYWVQGTSTVDWTAADIRMRDANGEKPKKATDGRSAECDQCHTATVTPLVAP